MSSPSLLHDTFFVLFASFVDLNLPPYFRSSGVGAVGARARQEGGCVGCCKSLGGTGVTLCSGNVVVECSGVAMVVECGAGVETSRRTVVGVIVCHCGVVTTEMSPQICHCG
ncbi:unnamed protein product [Cuscuta europaea]|uniref:Uncharacterized protein n=1 Tax=Cuscuta europaea TaxID=41803 RepID=A0A9P0Z427_CUSEU|nr:unnamed protein product [Cuscuta europaea]